MLKILLAVSSLTIVSAINAWILGLVLTQRNYHDVNPTALRSLLIVILVIYVAAMTWIFVNRAAKESINSECFNRDSKITSVALGCCTVIVFLTFVCILPWLQSVLLM